MFGENINGHEEATMTTTSKPATKSWAASIIVAAILVVPSGWAYVLVRHAVPRPLLDRLVIGMTYEEVRDVLGVPREIREDSVWEYSRWGNVGWVDLHFDENGRLQNINDESVFP